MIRKALHRGGERLPFLFFGGLKKLKKRHHASGAPEDPGMAGESSCTGDA
jgi:hypothetical protein